MKEGEIQEIKKRLDRIESNMNIISTTDDEYIASVYDALELNMKQQKRRAYKETIDIINERKQYIEDTWEKILSKKEAIDILNHIISQIFEKIKKE